MIMLMTAIITVIAAYLIGSVNFAVIFSKVFLKRDVRKLGSGNAGATNVLRNAGVLPGILTFVCDALKGLAASYMGYKMFEYICTAADTSWSYPIVGAYICGLFCMLGHIFPIFFQFKGGKGVATSVGIFLVCSPISIISGLGVFAVVVALSRTVSLASIIAATFVEILSIILFDTSAPFWLQVLLSFIMYAIVIIKHKENIKRLINGTESKFGKGGKK